MIESETTVNVDKSWLRDIIGTYKNYNMPSETTANISDVEVLIAERPELASETIFRSRGDFYDRVRVEAVVEAAVQKILPHMPAVWAMIKADDRYGSMVELIEAIAEGERVDVHNVAAEYITQERVFLEFSMYFGLAQSETFDAQETGDGAIAMSANGSLVTVTPPDRDGKRTVEYIRIPARAKANTATSPIKTPLMLPFRVGGRAIVPGLVNSSPLRRIALVPESTEAQEVNDLCRMVREAIGATRIPGVVPKPQQ